MHIPLTVWLSVVIGVVIWFVFARKPSDRRRNSGAVLNLQRQAWALQRARAAERRRVDGLEAEVIELRERMARAEWENRDAA